MEDKVASASMQIKGWKVPERDDSEIPYGEVVGIVKQKLASLEQNIERRYLKPPLGIKYAITHVPLYWGIFNKLFPAQICVRAPAALKSHLTRPLRIPHQQRNQVRHNPLQVQATTFPKAWLLGGRPSIGLPLLPSLPCVCIRWNRPSLGTKAS